MNTYRFLPHLPTYIIIALFFAFALWSIYAPFFGSRVNDVQAADPDLTVCDSGCDHTTVDAALSAATTGQVVQVNTGYDPAGDTDITFDTNTTTLQCQNDSITIGTSGTLNQIALRSGVTVQNCTFDRVRLAKTSLGEVHSNITISGNTFSTSSAPSSIKIENGWNATVTNNAGLGAIVFNLSSINLTIASNTVDLVADVAATGDGIQIGTINGNSATTTNSNVTITNNTVTSYSDAWDGSGWMGVNDAVNLTVASNTLQGATVSSTGKRFLSLSNVSGEAYGNVILDTVTSDSGSDTLVYLTANTSTKTYELDFHHNTLITTDDTAIELSNDNDASYDVTVTTSYNIFYSASSSADGIGIQYNNLNTSATIATTSQYNGYYNLSMNTPYGTEATSVTVDPLFTNTTTYNAISPYSTYFDVNGTIDIGHLAGAYYAVTVTESSGSTVVTEDGTLDTYTVVLTTAPSADVTITMASADGQVTTTPASLTFTTGNWNVAQIVTSSAVDDSIAEPISHFGTTTHSISSGDAVYNAVPSIASVGATITDNDRNWDVCASGCDFETLTAAFASSSIAIGDTFNVSSTYSSSAETYPLTFATTSLTVDCNNVGTIASTTHNGTGSNIYLATSSTIQNCTLNNVNLTTADSIESGVTITGNTSVTSTATTTITLSSASGVNNLTVSNNTGLKNISISPTDGGSGYTITGNTIYAAGSAALNLIASGGLTDVTISSNTLYWASNQTLASFSNTTNLTVASNTFAYFDTSVVSSLVAPLYIYGNNTSTAVTGNYFNIPPGNFYGAQMNANQSTKITATFTHNTCDNLTDNGYCLDANATSSGQLFVTSTNNIFHSSSSTVTGYGEQFSNYNSPISQINAYIASNGYYNVKSNTVTSSVNSWNDAGGHRTTKPWFRTGDSTGANDLHLAPHSLHCDDNMGAYKCTRATSTILLDDDGTIDYSTVYETGLSQTVTANLKNSDAVTLAAGTYGTSTISSVNNITFTGAGASTIINASSNENALTLSSVNSSTFSNFVVQNASTTVTSYLMSNSALKKGGVDYDDSSAFELPANATYLIKAPTCDGAIISADDTNVTSAIDATSNINLALSSDGGGNYATLYVVDSAISNASGVETACSLTVDHFIEDIFTVSDGVFTYNTAVATSNGISQSGSYTYPPTIASGVGSSYAGIKLLNSDTNTITNVTSTDNYYGYWFSGTSESNNISTSTANSSDGYDIYADGSANNNVKNSVFNTASSSIASTGNVDVYYKARVYTTNGSTAVASVPITMTRADAGATTSFTIAGDGYSAYTDFLLAFTMTSSSIGTTNGGYNPWTVAAAATSPYAALSTSATLNTQNQTITVTLSEAASESSSSNSSGGGVAPSPVASGSSAASATTFITTAPGSPVSIIIKGEQHTVTPEAPNEEGEVEITIESDPITVALGVGEESAIDIDEDTVQDILLRVIAASDTEVRLSVLAIAELEFAINHNMSEALSRYVDLSFNAEGVESIAISNTSDFTDASFEPYTKTKSWELEPGNGIKTVYVKLRTAGGSIRTVSDSIMLVDALAQSCPLAVGSAYKTALSSAVYYISAAHTEDGSIDTSKPCSKRAFTSPGIFFTYFDSWDDVTVVSADLLQAVPNDVLGFMPKGPSYNPQYGTLVKVVTHPNVYLLLGGHAHAIVNEAVFTALGYAWNWIEDVSQSFLDKYTKQDDVTTTIRPNYTMIKYAHSPDVYRIEPDSADPLGQVKRLVPDEATFESLGYRWDRIVTVSDTEVYEDGPPL